MTPVKKKKKVAKRAIRLTPPTRLVPGVVRKLADGAKGFDANSIISVNTARTFVKAGYVYAIRYVRRAAHHDYDLTSAEARDILVGGLGLMIVQHVAPEDWMPTPADGTSYGATAAAETKNVGIPSGVMVWLDLEGVNLKASADDVAAFCNNWYAQVAAAGYTPGIYVGWRPGLTNVQLYTKLHFSHYWGSYNVDGKSIPITRGFQMQQLAAKKSDLIPGFTNQNLDVDIIKADKLGGTPSVLMPV